MAIGAVVPSIVLVEVDAPVDPAAVSAETLRSEPVTLELVPWVPFLGSGGTTGAAGGPVTSSASTHLPVLVVPSQILTEVSSDGLLPVLILALTIGSTTGKAITPYTTC